MDFKSARAAGGLVLLSLLLGACARSVSPDGVQIELAEARARAAEQRVRIAELEARLVEVERRTQNHTADAQRGEDDTKQMLSKLLLASERLTAEVVKQRECSAPAVDARSAALDGFEFSSAGPALDRERFERVLELLRGYPLDYRSGISRQRREALRVLLRRDRAIDTNNPWTLR